MIWPTTKALRYYITCMSIPLFLLNVLELLNFAVVEDNEKILISYTLRSSLASTSSLTLAPIEDEVQTFPMEGKISLPDHPSSFNFSPAHVAIICTHQDQKNGAMLQL